MPEDTDRIQQVFDYWVEKCRPRFIGGGAPQRGRPPVLSDKRKRKIANALKLYGFDACIEAIEGCLVSDFHQGDNAYGIKYDDIELILRDPEHIERFISIYHNHQKKEFPRRRRVAPGGEPF